MKKLSPENTYTVPRLSLRNLDENGPIVAATNNIPSTIETLKTRKKNVKKTFLLFYLKVLFSLSVRDATYEKQFAMTLVIPPNIPEQTLATSSQETSKLSIITKQI